MTLDQEDIQAIANAIVLKLAGAIAADAPVETAQKDRRKPYNPVKFRETIRAMARGDRKAYDNYGREYKWPEKNEW